MRRLVLGCAMPLRCLVLGCALDPLRPQTVDPRSNVLTAPANVLPTWHCSTWSRTALMRCAPLPPDVVYAPTNTTGVRRPFSGTDVAYAVTRRPFSGTDVAYAATHTSG
eukprot:2938168-Rhodomonas_salina.3